MDDFAGDKKQRGKIRKEGEYKGEVGEFIAVLVISSNNFIATFP